jgi:hypothetical protein
VNVADHFRRVDLPTGYALQIGDGLFRHSKTFKLLLRDRAGYGAHIALNPGLRYRAHSHRPLLFSEYFKPVHERRARKLRNAGKRIDNRLPRTLRNYHQALLPARILAIEQRSLIGSRPDLRRPKGDNIPIDRKRTAAVVVPDQHLARPATHGAILDRLLLRLPWLGKSLRPSGSFIFRTVSNRAPRLLIRAFILAFRPDPDAGISVVVEVGTDNPDAFRQAIGAQRYGYQ